MLSCYLLEFTLNNFYYNFELASYLQLQFIQASSEKVLLLQWLL